jgi:integration host factor subunit alpha
MTKADIVQAVYTKLGGFSKKEAADLVDQVFDSMKETLGRGEKIKISGFGNFVLRDKRQRQGRNPQTGEPIVITARRVLNFKASQLLKQALNEGLSDEEWSDSPAAANASPSAGNPHGSSTQTNGVQNGQSSGGDGMRSRTNMDSGPGGSDRGGRG